MPRKKIEKDNCEFCLGAKGGVKGNENVINGVVTCDYCTVLTMKIKSGATTEKFGKFMPPKPPGVRTPKPVPVSPPAVSISNASA